VYLTTLKIATLFVLEYNAD